MEWNSKQNVIRGYFLTGTFGGQVGSCVFRLIFLPGYLYLNHLEQGEDNVGVKANNFLTPNKVVNTSLKQLKLEMN